MTHQNQATVKLGKSFARLKKDLISSKKLLSQTILPINAFQLAPVTHSKENYELKTSRGSHGQPSIFERNKQSGTTKAKENKHTFGRIVDFTKSMVNSNVPFTIKHPQVSSLVSIINQAQAEKNYQNMTTISKLVTNKNRHLIHEKYCTHSAVHSNKKVYVNMRNYCTCSPGRHNYHEDVEKAVNQQILAELNACYAYLSMACYFGRTDVALPGCSGFFMHMHKEEHEHALTFINYQNKRGGHVKLCPITAPECQNWESINTAFSVAIEMEKLVKEKLVALNDVAEKHHDLSVMNMVTGQFIEEQERSICELSRLLVRIEKMGDSGMSEYLFDKEIHTAFVEKSSDPTTQANGGDNSIYV